MKERLRVVVVDDHAMFPGGEVISRRSAGSG